MRAPVLIAGILLLAAATGVSADDDSGGVIAPRYGVAGCCQLCPAASDPASYHGSAFLEDFRVLQQGRQGWLFRSELDLPQRFDISQVSIQELRRLVAALRQRGTELMIVYQPPRGLADAHQLTPEQFERYDYEGARASYAAALDRLRQSGAIVPALDRLIVLDKGYDYYFRRDHHWSPAGAERTAQVIAETLKALPLYAQLPRKQFVTRSQGLIAKPGTLQKVAAQICGGGWSMQHVMGYATEPAEGGDLLGDEAAPEVVLVGTSNSDDIGGYNFDGYLEQHLQTDVLNVAITGGSFEGSLLKYLPSEAFQKRPPKLLIWETPYQDYPDAAVNPHRTFRQAVALVNDGCRGKPAILSKSMELRQGSNELLFNGAGKTKDLPGAGYLLDFQFSDPGIKEIHSDIWYFNGMKESLQLRFKQYVDNAGRFVVQLRNDRKEYAEAGFMAATIELPQAPAKPLRVEARLCAADGAGGPAGLRTAGVQ